MDTTLDEPHAHRRLEIARHVPQILSLNGPEWKSKWIAMALAISHVTIACNVHRLSTFAYLLVFYVVGLTLTHALFLAIHELAHNTFFSSVAHNKRFSILMNCPIGIPFAIAFRDYHLEHHKYQGVYGVDTDLPSEIECRLVQGKVAKSLWLSGQIVAYALRPCLIRPKRPTRWHIANALVQIAFDVILVRLVGWSALCYLLSCILCCGFHPCAGHFVSEHYVFPHKSPTQETYSYYGVLNYLTWNVGYHNEHHDFPYVPWSRLPTLSRMASPYYETLETCESWSGVLLEYVLRDEVGPHSRVKRPHPHAK